MENSQWLAQLGISPWKPRKCRGRVLLQAGQYPVTAWTESLKTGVKPRSGTLGGREEQGQKQILMLHQSVSPAVKERCVKALMWAFSGSAVTLPAGAVQETPLAAALERNTASGSHWSWVSASSTYRYKFLQFHTKGLGRERVCKENLKCRVFAR